MESIYFYGMIATLVIDSVKTAVALHLLTSIQAKNFAKVGSYYNFMSGTFTRSYPNNIFSFGWFLFWGFVVAPAFSWLSVLSAVASFITEKAKAAGMPERIKEISYRLSAVELSQEEMEKIEEECREYLRGARNSSDLNSHSQNAKASGF